MLAGNSTSRPSESVNIRVWLCAAWLDWLEAALSPEEQPARAVTPMQSAPTQNNDAAPLKTDFFDIRIDPILSVSFSIAFNLMHGHAHAHLVAV